MGLFSKIFKKNKGNVSSDWDEIAAGRADLDLSNPIVREQYVISCLEQMKEASSEIDRINAEYAVVTSYLMDMEEIEALPEEDKKELADIARHIKDLRKAHDKYVLTPSTMTEHEYNHIDSMFDEVQEGIAKMKAEEDYRDKVKSDLKRIDREITAYRLRQREVRTAMDNTRGIATISLVASGVLVVILFLLQALLDLDVVLGYYIAVALIAVVMTVVYLKYNGFSSEKSKVDRGINELILLENKVKIRYVNNKNLLDYLYIKYEVASSAQLQDLYEKFLKEKEARRSFEKNEAAYEDAASKLLRRLKNLRIKDPEIWLHQSDALFDSREMVEIRHSLIGRRQKLRKQIEYNEQIAIEASDEVKDVMRDYPAAKDSLLDLVNKYGNNG